MGIWIWRGIGWNRGSGGVQLGGMDGPRLRSGGGGVDRPRLQ